MTLTYVAGLVAAQADASDPRRRYLPILKARQGELKALTQLSDPVEDDLLPIV
jgi:Beta protein